ncbi:N-acetyl transferase [Hyphodiscus hymeniophilus]|uniref:N-acetyl transferase n=1 Tax=Hyphodiscus hymeniophilus TaxID=353542 RepID=A0A9P6VIN4_9HELO|nr:N-acetyl transferase [Hyphodiscus hymeniophilus]
MSEASELQHQTWSKDQYTISTDPSLIPVKRLNEAFASDDMYWAIPSPDSVLRETLDGSLCFGLYQSQLQPQPPQPDSELIGFARLITDHSTFAWLTDVHIWRSHQGRGFREVADRLREGGHG